MRRQGPRRSGTTTCFRMEYDPYPFYINSSDSPLSAWPFPLAFLHLAFKLVDHACGEHYQRRLLDKDHLLSTRRAVAVFDDSSDRRGSETHVARSSRS